MIEPIRRRTERLLLTIPIRVEGVNPKGEKFSENTRTLVINRHGARIHLKHLVAQGARLRIVNVAANAEAEFRVVGPTQPLSEEGGEWGVECQDEKPNIWGIDFPPPLQRDSACSALLECRRCHAAALTPVSLVELDVLKSSGLLTKECKACGQPTSWGYSEQQIGLRGLGEEGESLVKEVLEPPPPEGNRRVHPRVALKLPIRIRNYYGRVEFGKSENVSKRGLAFISETDYEIGEALQLTCPYDPGGHNIELRGRVVHRQEIKGAGRKVYGICYVKES